MPIIFPVFRYVILPAGLPELRIELESKSDEMKWNEKVLDGT